MKKKTHFIVLAAGLQESSLLIPKSLVPLGHHPMVCILVETLLEIENVEVHLLVSSVHETLFGREMKRWFPRHEIHVFGSEGVTTSESLFAFLQKNKEWENDHPCHIVQSNFPLLSRSALEHFLHVSTSSPSAVLGVNKTRWNEDRVLRNVVVQEGYVTAIEDSSFNQVGFLACSKFSTGTLRQHLPTTKKYHEIISRVEEKPFLVKLQSYPIELDSIGIRTSGDKTFAEHKFMEKEHADFLTQCYCIWKECRSMEARIVKLENQSKK